MHPPAHNDLPGFTICFLLEGPVKDMEEEREGGRRKEEAIEEQWQCVEESSQMILGKRAHPLKSRRRKERNAAFPPKTV